MGSSWTVRRILSWTAQDFGARGLPSPRLDAEVLLAHALGVDRVRLYMDLERELSDGELAAMRALVARRRAREPVAYLVGRREFFGRAFLVSPAVLVPRPETETLVERALALLPAGRPSRVLDLCTGSGVIGLTLLAERPDVAADLTDLSADALAVARANAAALGVADRARFHAGDLFAALPPDARPPGGYDLVVANPPYVAEREASTLAADVVGFEPHVALFAGGDGLDVVRRIARAAPAWLAPGGALLVEIGAEQGDAARGLAEAAGAYGAVAVRADLGRRDRVLEARLPGGDADAAADPRPAGPRRAGPRGSDGVGAPDPVAPLVERAAEAPPARHGERVVIPDEAPPDVDALVGERVVVRDDAGV